MNPFYLSVKLMGVTSKMSHVCTFSIVKICDHYQMISMFTLHTSHTSANRTQNTPKIRVE